MPTRLRFTRGRDNNKEDLHMRFGGDLARSFAFSGRRICLAMSVLALGGCADLSAVGRDMMSKPYDAPTARAEALRSILPPCAICSPT